MRRYIVFARSLLQMVARRGGKFCVGLCLEPSFVSEVCRVKDRRILCPCCVRFEGGGGGVPRAIAGGARWIRSTTTVSKMTVGNAGSRAFVPLENFHRRKNGPGGVLGPWGGCGQRERFGRGGQIESGDENGGAQLSRACEFRGLVAMGMALVAIGWPGGMGGGAEGGGSAPERCPSVQ